MCTSLPSTASASNSFAVTNISQVTRHVNLQKLIKTPEVSTLGVGYCQQILTICEMGRQFYFFQLSNTKFHENPFYGSQVVAHTDGQTDGG
jgi:hypothetical protein